MKVMVTIHTADQVFAAGATAGDWHIDAIDERDNIETYEGADPCHLFDLIEGATYSLRGTRLDMDRKPIGPVASVSYIVGSDLVVIPVAGSITAAAIP
jgi:hypothetical protein